MGKTNAFSSCDLLKSGGTTDAAVAVTGLLHKKAKAAQGNVPRWAMVIDLRRCVGCYSCQVSCKMENSVPMEGFNTRVNAVDRGEYPKAERVFLPTLCNHCAGEKKGEEQVPPCVENCPEAESGKMVELNGVKYITGATYKRPDGMILLDSSLCIGCYRCIEACPYGARYISPYVKLTRPDRKKDLGVGKCTFCQHRVDEGLEPACVRNCVGKARYFGDLNDQNSVVSKLIKDNPTEVLKPEEKTDPKVYYIQLDETVAKMEDLLNPLPKKT